MDKRRPQGGSKFGAKKSSPFKKDFNDKPQRSFDKDSTSDKSFEKPKRNFYDRGERPSFSDKPKRNFGKSDSTKSFDRPKRNFSDKGERSSYSDKPKRNFDKDAGEEKPKRAFADRGERAKFYADKNEKSKAKKSSFERGERAPYDPSKPKNYKKDYSKKKDVVVTNADKGLIRLNKYISNAGICSRREADDLIKSGCVSVNGKVITELGFTVKTTDEVNYSGARLKSEKHVYLLLNKPKDYITTADDERGRKTVMELVAGACKQRIYPVGRLDRNTTGLLLFTNDGELTKKLTHPKHEIEKLYHVELDKNLKQDDFMKLKEA